MAEKREWTLVSALVGEIEFGISGGKEGTTDYIPKTSGFVIRVSYANETEKMKQALCSTRIAVQNTIRQFYRKNKRFPFSPGKVQKVNGSGEFTLPMTVHIDRIETQAKNGELEMADKIRLAKAMGLEIPAEWLTDSKPEPTQMVPTAPQIEYKYNEDHLKRAKTEQLILLAEQEGLEGLEDMERSEIIEELALIEK